MKKHFLLNLFYVTTLFLFAFTLNAEAKIESSPDIPEIISRAQWGADESKMTWEEEYAEIEKFVVHHSASSNLEEDDDGSGEYKEMVNNIYEYHTGKKTWTDEDGDVVSGFGDIGYNYIIDPNGNIYEGRSGGNGVIGGHVSGFNTGSVGISILGNYQENTAGTNDELNNEIIESVEKLIGWIAANNSVNINKTTDFNDKDVDGVIGHRDLAATLCPGSLLYAELDEIQENAYLYYKKYKEYAYKIKGQQAVYVLENGYKIKFDSEEDLPSSYEDRNIVYISKTQLNAYQYKDISKYPNGSLLQEAGENTIYYIENGKKRALNMTEEDFLDMGFSQEEIIEVSESELSLYDEGYDIKVGPEGKLIKDSNDNVYYIENGKKRIFTSAELFNYLNYSWSKISDDENSNYYLDGTAMKYPDNTLIKENGDSSVYLILDGKRKLFPSAEIFEKLGYKWKDIIEIDSSELVEYALSGNVTYPNGTLIRGEGDESVYLVENGKKRKITSETLLKSLGYDFSGVVIIPKSTLTDYATGSDMTYPEGTLVKTENSSAVYQISQGTKKDFTSLALFEKTGSKWSDVIEITEAEMSLYQNGGHVSYPDGSLLKVKGGEKIYVIKSGQAGWIKSATEFINSGYKWSDVIEITEAEMSLYVEEVETEKNEEDSSETAEDDKEDDQDENLDEENEEEGEKESVSTEPKMRVAITYSENDNIIITADGAYSIQYYDEDGEIYKTVKKSSGEKTTVPFFDWEKYMKFIPESENTILQVLSYQDPSWNGETDDNRFRGSLELKYSEISDKLWVINELDLEDYLNGIAEATTYTEEEYLKAFSTIARTYAMYYIEKGGKHTGEDFYLKNSRNGNGNDQLYRGYDLEQRAPHIVEANQETEGEIIQYKGNTIVAAYSSDSGGTTKSACDVLSSKYCSDEFNYLDGGIKDPEDTEHEQSKISASHGAGMSAVGASQMAKEGSDWEEIIKYYYPGVNIEKYY